MRSAKAIVGFNSCSDWNQEGREMLCTGFACVKSATDVEVPLPQFFSNY